MPAVWFQGLVQEEGKPDTSFLALVPPIGRVRAGSFRDRYQDALRELVEAKTKGLATTPSAITEPPKVIGLMGAL
jgi:hypothetical protein